MTWAVLLEIIWWGWWWWAVDSVNWQSLEIWWETFSTYKTIKALQDGVLNSITCTSSTNSNWTVSIKLYHNWTLHSTITYVWTLANWKYNKVFTSPTDFTQIDFNKYDIIEIRVSDTWTSLSTDLTITLW